VKSGQGDKGDGEVFFLLSNHFGCLGSIVINIALSALLILLMRGCSSGAQPLIPPQDDAT
jgi:hypothetical protein